MLYYEKMKALIGGWRQVWNQGEFPFLYVQIAPYNYGRGPDQLAWNLERAAGVPFHSEHRHGRDYGYYHPE